MAIAYPEQPALDELDEPTSVAGRLSRFVGKSAVSTFLIVVALMWLLPTFGLFVSSLRTAEVNNAVGWWTAFTTPSQITFATYANILTNDAILGSFWNTVMITVPSALGVTAVASLAAYVLAWGRFRGRDAVFLVVVALLVVPLQIALIPIAEMFGALGIFRSLPGVIIFHIGFGLPFAIFLMRNFFVGLPKELMEAARVDGASEATVFFRVVLPLGIPAIASLFIFQFLWVWNDLLVGLVFAGTETQPLTVAILQNTRQFGSSIDIIAPAAFLSMIVPLIVFLAFQRYFVQGLLAGSVK